MKPTLLVVGVIGAAAMGAAHATLRGQPAPAWRVQPASTAQRSRSVWDGVYSAEQATRGEAIYLEACSVCHGPDLRGIDESPPLVGSRFTSNWNGTTLGDLFERLRISMPLSSPGKLSRQQNADVLAYMLSANKFPSGERALPRQTGILSQIVFEATKPRGGR